MIVPRLKLPLPSCFELSFFPSSSHPILYVLSSDAVGAIQLNSSPITFNIGSGEFSNLASLADEIQELAMLGGKRDKKMSIPKNVIDVEQSSAAHAASVSSNDYLRWAAKTSLKDGAAKLLSWHLDRAIPFFRAASSDADVDYSKGHSIAFNQNLITNCILSTEVMIPIFSWNEQPRHAARLHTTRPSQTCTQILLHHAMHTQRSFHFFPERSH